MRKLTQIKTEKKLTTLSLKDAKQIKGGVIVDLYDWTTPGESQKFGSSELM